MSSTFTANVNCSGILYFQMTEALTRLWREGSCLFPGPHNFSIILSEILLNKEVQEHLPRQLSSPHSSTPCNIRQISRETGRNSTLKEDSLFIEIFYMNTHANTILRRNKCKNWQTTQTTLSGTRKTAPHEKLGSKPTHTESSRLSLIFLSTWAIFGASHSRASPAAVWRNNRNYNENKTK